MSTGVQVVYTEASFPCWQYSDSTPILKSKALAKQILACVHHPSPCKLCCAYKGENKITLYMHNPDTVYDTPQITDDCDGLDTILQRWFFCFPHPFLSHFLYSVQARAILQPSHELKWSLSICALFFSCLQEVRQLSIVGTWPPAAAASCQKALREWGPLSSWSFPGILWFKPVVYSR